MKTLIAIGGGSFQKGETKEIDAYAIKRTQKEHPHVLLFPTASKDDQGYAKRFKQYMRQFNCSVEVIRLFHTKCSADEIKEKIRTCDILYFGAGNLIRLMSSLQEWSLVETIKTAYVQGIVCMGNSAGASALLAYGYSDVHDDGSTYEDVGGIGLESYRFCPHAQDKKRMGFYESACKSFPNIPCHDRDAFIIEDGETSYFHENDLYSSFDYIS